MSGIREIQLAQLDILKQTVRIFEENNLTYFASYGTLLGAVRHKGFIPWDDDIDLYMPRPDYDRFCAIAQKQLQKPYFLQTHETDPAYTYHSARVQNIDTAYIIKNQPKDEVSGIFVDITPLDGCIPDKTRYKKLRSKYRLYKYCVIDWFDREKYFGKSVKRLIGKVVNCCMFGNQDHEYFFKLQEELYQEIPYNSADYVTDYPGGDHFFKKSLLGEKIYLDFEDIKLCCPANYDEILKLCFGDYMTMPPEKDRKPHHGILVADTQKSYIYYNDVRRY